MRLLETAKRGLGSGGKERDACAILCARVLSRDDVWRTELPLFITWAVNVFSSEGNLLLVVLSLRSNLLIENWSVIGDLKRSCAFRARHRSLNDTTSNDYPTPNRVE